MSNRRNISFDVPLSSSTPLKKLCTEKNSVLSQQSRGTAGVIKCINVKNFMCHDHFEMVFNPRINFISGRNGSGKSAIQTALIIGLGGDTRATSRGTTVSSFIKEGKNQAIIQITMTNNGFKAHNPEVYGNEITVIRTLSKTSSFKIRAENGQQYPVKKAEIKALADRFQIQATNPVAILNQNTARTFLNSSDPKQKYKLFMEATLFDAILSKKVETVNDLKLMNSILEDKRRALGKLEVELNKDKEKLALIEKCKQAFERKSELQNELLWSRVVQSEHAKGGMLEKRKELLAQVKDIQGKIDKKETKERQFHEKIAEMTAAIQAQVSELKKYQDQHDKLQQTKRGKVRELEEKKLKEVSIKKKIASREHDNCNIKAEMDDYERKKVELEEKKQEVRRAHKTLAGDKMNAEKALVQAATVIHQKKQKIQKLNVVINQKEEHLRRVQSKQSNTLSQYGPWMQQLVDSIKEAFKKRKFSKMPRGPLGAYIKMKDPNLAALAEYGLGYGNLRKFVVNTREDEKELKLIMDRVMPPNVARLPITCAKFVEKPFNGIREAHYNNVFSNLEIEDPVVSNILIELTNCQGTILIEDNKTAHALLSNPRNVPANTVLGYTPDGSKHFPNSGRGVYKTYQGSLNSKVPRFVQTEQTTLIRELTNEIKQLKSEMTSMQQEIRADEKELMRCQQHERDVANQLSNLVSKLKKLQDDLNRSVVDEESKLAPLDLYKEEYSNNLRDIDKCETELKQIWEEQKVIKTRIKQLDEELAELAPYLESDEVTKMAEVEEMKTNLVRFKSDTGTWQSKLKEAQTKVEHLTKRLEDQSAMVELYTKEAEELASRDLYPNPRPMSEVEEELIEVQNLLESAEEMGEGNPLELEAAISERLEEFERGKVEFDVADSIIKTKKKLLNWGENACNSFEPSPLCLCLKCFKLTKYKTEILLRAAVEAIRLSFVSTLSVRGFEGELHMDTGNTRLDIYIVPRDNDSRDKLNKSQLKDTASLSGGEKSYTTVAFIMALWSTMAVPFFSMDEFDVFMDSINRKNIMELLLHNARNPNMKDRQFLFLTPLDCSILNSDIDLTIHKMLDPQRHNAMSQG
uniref:Structural maintenance of chromosomes protein 6 n=2 Tax=Cacopsylla melanoneura TaxID=428564 RepID=A0A8D8SCH2_9HEMI